MARPGTFPKGISGNPGGRKKTSPEFLAAVEAAAEGALANIITLSIEAEEESVRLRAATWLAERAYGKPEQAVSLSGDGGAPFLIQIVGYAAEPAGQAIPAVAAATGGISQPSD